MYMYVYIHTYIINISIEVLQIFISTLIYNSILVHKTILFYSMIYLLTSPEMFKSIGWQQSYKPKFILSSPSQPMIKTLNSLNNFSENLYC